MATMNANYKLMMDILQNNFDSYEVREDFKVKVWDTTGTKPILKGYKEEKMIVFHLKEDAKFPGRTVTVTYNKGKDSEVTRCLATYYKAIRMGETNWQFAQKGTFATKYLDKFAELLPDILPQVTTVAEAVSEDIPF